MTGAELTQQISAKVHCCIFVKYFVLPRNKELDFVLAIKVFLSLELQFLPLTLMMKSQGA